jgi:hypothetical protein
VVKKVKSPLSSSGLLFRSVLWLSIGGVAIANPIQLKPVTAANLPKLPLSLPVTSDRLTPQSRQCPTDLETLTALLLRDLPSYANRISQRARRRSQTDSLYSSVILAGYPEYEPLTLGPGEYTPATPGSAIEPPQQVFLTTLERQYTGKKTIELQLFHWVFLVNTNSGWQLATMYSRIRPSPPGSLPTPPFESSNGIIGQGVRTWLRDCRAGYIRPLQKPTPVNPQS